MLTKWIISRIPNHEDVKNERVRSAYGKAASLVGIGCNVLLFAGSWSPVCSAARSRSWPTR